MKPLRWSQEKNDALRIARGISFECVVVAVESGGLLDILSHPNPARYPGQRVLVVACGNYVHLVPFVRMETSSWLSNRTSTITCLPVMSYTAAKRFPLVAGSSTRS